MCVDKGHCLVYVAKGHCLVYVAKRIVLFGVR